MHGASTDTSLAPSPPPPVPDVLKRTLSRYLEHVFNYLWMSILLAAAFFVPIMAVDFIGIAVRKGVADHHALVTAVFDLAGRGVGVLLACIPLSALLILAGDEELEIGPALRKGLPRVPRLLWLLWLVLFTVAGGLAWAVLPGLLMAAWFVFAPLLCVLDGVRGEDAMSGSREYFRGQTLGVLFRLWPAAALVAVPLFIPGFGVFLRFLFFPFAVLYVIELQRDLHPSLGTRAFTWPSGRPYLWLAAPGNALWAAVLLAFMAVQGAVHSSPDSLAGKTVRFVRPHLSGPQLFLDRRLPKERREALEDVGKQLLLALEGLEKKYVGDFSTGKNLPGPAVKKKAEPKKEKKFPFQDSWDPLIRLLGDEDWMVRRDALSSIGNTGSLSYVPAVEAVIREDRSSDVRLKARSVLEALKKAGRK